MAKKILGAKTGVLPVLLCEDIEKLGWLGDVVEVKTGYARNYLIPQGLAKAASEANIKSISEERDRRAQQRKSERVKLEESVTAILAAGKAGEGAEAVVAAKANEQGHLFGSVTAREIATNLREQGFDVPDDAVQLAGIGDRDSRGGGRHSGSVGHHFGGIKEVGTHTVRLKFAEDLICQINVVVVAEQAPRAPCGEEGDEAE